MLAQEISINKKRRPDGRMAPCAICLPQGSKWTNDGSLIWCGATEAVYCIGPDCSKGDMRRKLAIARNILSQTEREQRETEYLIDFVVHADPVLAWIESQQALAADVSIRHKAFAKAVPKFRSALSRFVRTGIPAGMLTGEGMVALVASKPFLSGGWNIPADLAKVRETFRRFVVEARGQPEQWVSALAPTVRREHLQAAEDAVKLMRQAVERMQAASSFFSPATFKVLGIVSNHDAAPTDFTLHWAGTTATITHREEFWRGKLVSPRPESPPYGRHW